MAKMDDMKVVVVLRLSWGWFVAQAVATVGLAVFGGWLAVAYFTP